MILVALLASLKVTDSMPNASNSNAILIHYEGGNTLGKNQKCKELGNGINQRKDGS